MLTAGLQSTTITYTQLSITSTYIGNKLKECGNTGMVRKLTDQQ